jgi:hypothetical protein
MENVPSDRIRLIRTHAVTVSGPLIIVPKSVPRVARLHPVASQSIRGS